MEKKRSDETIAIDANLVEADANKQCSVTCRKWRRHVTGRERRHPLMLERTPLNTLPPDEMPDHVFAATVMARCKLSARL